MKAWTLVAAIGCAVPVSGAFQISQAPAAAEGQPCRFLLARGQAAPMVLAEESLLPRIQVMRQPDAPIAIVHADLRKIVVSIAGYSFSIAGRYSVQVKNVSDVALTDINVRLTIRTSTGSVGAGTTLKSLLAPGAVATMTDVFASGEGTKPGDEEPALEMFIRSVRIADCVYEPAKIWPSVSR